MTALLPGLGASELVAIAAVAVLFIVFGLTSRAGRCPSGGGCAGCTSSCHRHPSSTEHTS